MTDGATIRPYDAGADRPGLWELKREFEVGLGSETGGDDKAAAYAGKLTPRCRDRWLAWVDRCVDDDPGCAVVCDTGYRN